MAEKIVKDMGEDFLVCSICMNQFKTPKMLPCIHSFCEVCLERYSEKQDDKGKVPCPTCRRVCQLPKTGVKGLQTNFHLNNLAERLKVLEAVTSKSDTAAVCESCKSPNIVSFCTDCKFAFCSKCKDHHSLYAALRDHNIILITRMTDPEFQEEWKTSKSPYCDVHTSEKLHFYCKTCSKLICSHCAIVVHSKHECTEVNNQFEISRVVLREQLEKCKGHLENVIRKAIRGQEAVMVMEATNREVTMKIEEHFNNVMKAMEEKLLESKTKLIKEIEETPTNVREEIRKAKECIEGITDVQTMSQKILEQNNPWEVIAMSNDLENALSELGRESSSLKWLDLELKHEVHFTPSQKIPVSALGSCRIDSSRLEETSQKVNPFDDFRF